MVYEIKETKKFSKLFRKLPNEVQVIFAKKLEEVKMRPLEIGDKIKVYDWFREIKYQDYRLYYLVYEKQVVVLLVSVSDKKNQQEIIDSILENIKNLKEDIDSICKE
jgi:mRNA-degrading endonuclease RelE of RelBE toxin-antitoxin system